MIVRDIFVGAIEINWLLGAFVFAALMFDWLVNSGFHQIGKYTTTLLFGLYGYILYITA